MANKFIEILKTLDKDEFRSFGKWLNSPWCNSNKKLPALFNVVKKYYPKLDSPKLEYEPLFKAALPDKKYSYSMMSNLISEGYSQAEDFLIHQHLKKDKSTRQNFLTEELRERQADILFFKISDKEVNRLESKPVKDWEDYLNLFKLNRRVYHHPNQSLQIKPGKVSILKTDDNLSLLYLLEKAAIINEKIFRNRILKNENYNLTKELKIWRTASEDVKHPSIDFYRRRFGYTEENMLNEFYNLKFDIFDKFEELDENSKKIHLRSLINDVMFLRKKKLIDISELFPLYKLGLKTGILIHSGIITQNTYVTFITVSNTIREFNSTKKFIEEYTDYLPKNLRFDAGNWAKAHTLYSTGNLQKSLEALNSIEFKLNYFQRIARVLSLQVYFDLYINDSTYEFYLKNYLNAFEKWIFREKSISKTNAEPYLRFIQKCRALVKIHSSIDFNQNELINLLTDVNKIAAINWLKQKQEEIIQLKTKKSL